MWDSRWVVSAIRELWLGERGSFGTRGLGEERPWKNLEILFFFCGGCGYLIFLLFCSIQSWEISKNSERLQSFSQNLKNFEISWIWTSGNFGKMLQESQMILKFLGFLRNPEKIILEKMKIIFVNSEEISKDFKNFMKIPINLQKFLRNPPKS